MRAPPFAVPAQAESWSTSEVALGFGLPVAVVLVGLTVFLGGRSERRALRTDAEPQDGLGAPPGSTDVGSVEGFGAEERPRLIMAASRKVLIGLFITLAGALALLFSTVTRLLS
ncbi:MAG TPA: hypothetical protein VJ976_12080 [Ornithinimicrobium sp.]|uniref:hypothetical protein n=1 Tax=Ornithinimicrobium sp. TaxID=1977084 RepID=UPI002B4A6245|nr:hypothetical protein [Ornithinimicrobium sp.]HKJ13112.1 hypothetical protein [Ornithinimicrobium sp.]